MTLTDQEFHQYTNAVPLYLPDQQGREFELRRQLLPLSEINAVRDSKQLVRGWLGSGTLAMLYGPSNSGKTFVALGIAMHVASGVPYRGCKVRTGQVIYIAAEGGGSIRNRIAAMKKAKPELCQHDNFYLLPTALDLHAPGDAAALCEAMPQENIALVVIDTLARSMGAGDENSARDIAQFVTNVDHIRTQTGATVLVVHHSGKDTAKGARGSSALLAAVDTEIAIKTKGKLECCKQRDLEIPKPLFFNLKSVDLGNDSEGDAVTSAIVIEADSPTPKPERLKSKAQAALQALVVSLRDHGSIQHGPNFPSDREVVPLEVWRSQCDADGLTSGTSDSAPRNAFNSNKVKLMDKNIIRIHNNYVWRVQDAE